MTLIVDASMAIAWVFPDEQTESSRKVLSRVGDEGGFAPALWRLEVANVLRSAIRKKRCDENFAVQSLDLLKRLQITIDPETDVHAWGATRELAGKHDLSVYDAAYLELAIRKDAILATRDGALATAAKRVGLEVLFD